MKNCHDCGAEPGQLHQRGCDVERCPRCGGQVIGCNCVYIVCGIGVDTLEKEHPDIYNNGPTREMYETFDREWEARRMPWTGIWPGEVECIEFGWYAKFVDGKGWVRCDAGDPDGHPDLNRLATSARWDANEQRFKI